MIARRLRQTNDKFGVLRLVEYITATQGKNHRVGEVFISNCRSEDDIWLASREMLTRQLMNTRSQDCKTYHLLVSFQQGEQPTAVQLRKIESELCAKLGFAQHQRVAAVHYDTGHIHMHVAINKIHPKKYTIHSPYYDFSVLGKACVELEQKLGLTKDNHEPAGKTKGERQARDIEALTGSESLHTWIHREVFEKLKEAKSWDALHTELARAGLTLSLRGAGVVLTSASGYRITGSALHRSFSKLHLEKRLGSFQPRPERQATDIEALTGNESLHTWIHREAFEKLKKAESWAALHAELAKAGLTLSLRGAGVVLTSNSGHRLTGSNLHRSFSKFHLEKRLGEFRPRPDWCGNIRPEKEYQRNPLVEPANPLRAEYEKLREANAEAKDLRLNAVALEYTGKKEAILAGSVADRARAKTTPISRFPKRRLYAAIRGKYRSQLEKLMAETKRARKAVYGEFPSQTWVRWLQDQAKAGRLDAVEALRKRAFSLAKKNGAALRGETTAEPGLIPDQRIDGVTKRGTVIYDLGSDAVRDDGESFRISAGATADTDIMALKLAQRRFGNVIFADGDRAFRDRMIKAAVEGKVFIKFGDPAMERRRNELFRIKYRERKELENGERRPDYGHGSRPPASGLAPDEVRSILADTVRKTPPAHGDGHAVGGRPEHGYGRSPASGTSMGLTAEEVRNILASSVRKPAGGDGHAAGKRMDNRHSYSPAPGTTMGLTPEEVRNILANSIHKSVDGDGHAVTEKSDNKHARDEERGSSLSR